MNQLITLLIFTFSTFGFAQNSGLIVGKVVDKNFNNAPLIFANISVKGSALQSETDVTGLFLLENLQDGDYTLVCSFIGYNSEEIKVHVDALNPTEINIALVPSTISLNDISALTAAANVAKKDDKTSFAFNN